LVTYHDSNSFFFVAFKNNFSAGGGVNLLVYCLSNVHAAMCESD